MVLNFQEKAAMKRMNSRQRPLHASGVSIFSMADIAYRKTLNFPGPFGSTCRRIAKLAESANPLIFAIQYQLLAILSFLDDHIVVIEKMMEKLFPPSSLLLDKIDDMVLVIMSLPEKFDQALNKLPDIMHQIGFMESVLVHLISWLNCLISTLNRWGLENRMIREVTVDVSTICSGKFEPQSRTLSSVNSESRESFLATSESEASEAESMRMMAMGFLTHNKRGSYKEALEKGREENSHKKKKKYQSPKHGRKEKDSKDRDDESVNAAKMEKKFWRQKIVKKEKEEKEDGNVNVKDEVGQSGGLMKEEDQVQRLLESRENMKNDT
ncbi:uncharacterized protein G2W53_034598 [Senna tora]|uniref:Uncharacterized protein n=1 Tax=Senna tora TaxID=362788 RepID=A0A834W922_9FABA|nr:uncharacterized protein G2W53_034598 [Senna tora]